MKKQILQFLNIRSDESKLVTDLFCLQFFQGFGIAIFNIVSLTLLLEHFSLTGLPKAFMFSAVLLLIAGYIYTRFEHALEIKDLVPGVIIFIAISILVFFGLYCYYPGSSKLIFIMFSWFYVIYLLGNLEFWGVAALLFDIRQSKRLFGIIGMGDIPGKLVGYSAVTLWIKFVSNENLLFLSFASVLVSIIFYFRLKKAGHLDLKVHHEHKKHDAVHHPSFSREKVIEMVKDFLGNRMITNVAALSFIIVTCLTIISFSFYAEVEHKVHNNNEELESFIALFYSGGKILAIFIRLILTGRITNLLGTKGSLLVSPIILLVFLLGVMVLPLFTSNPAFMLVAFGLMMVLTEVLKTSLQEPIFLSLMQPLSSHMRLKGHTLVKGVMDPFGMAFSGFMLYGLIRISGDASLFLLSYLLLFLVIVWIAMIFVVDREYVKTLVVALNKRYSVGQEINLSDEKTLSVLESKISNGERGEAIYILHLIEKQYTEDKEGLVIKALRHPNVEVRLEAIKLAERKRIFAALPVIEELVNQKTEAALMPEAVKAKCMLQPDELENLDLFIEAHDERLMKAAVTGLMTSGGISAVVTAGQKLLQLIASPHAADRKMAAEIIGDLGVQSFYKPLLNLLKDENAEVVQAAIIASGKVKNEKLVGPLMKMFWSKKYEKLVADALHQAGDVSLKEIKHALIYEKLSRQQRARLILLCGRIGSDQSTIILDELVWKLPSFRTDIFHSLHLCEFKSQPHNRQQHIDLMGQYVNSAMRILFMISELERTPTAKILVDALYLELNEIREAMLLLFSFVYDKEKMMKAKNAFQLAKKEPIANALEVIEIEVPKDISLRFAKIYELGSISDKCAELRIYFKEDQTYEGIIDTILYDKNHHHYHRWTKAAALHSAIFYQGVERKRWLDKMEKDPDILLKETATQIMHESVSRKADLPL